MDREHTTLPERYLGGALWSLISLHYLTWLKYLSGSLWLDECGTVWLTAGGFRELFQRSHLFLHTPLFTGVESLAQFIGGPGEVPLRMPAWLAIGFAIVLFYQLAKEVLDPISAQVATAIFTVWPGIGHAAADARPYAFALAALCGAYLFFVRAVRDGRSRDFCWFVIFAATVVHFQLLFLYVLGVPVLFLALFERRALLRFRSAWLWCAGGFVVLLLPLSSYYISLLGWGSGKSFSPTPNPMDLVKIIMPFGPLAFFGVAALFSVAGVREVHLNTTKLERSALAFSVLAAALPVVLLYGVSVLGSSKLFIPRYLLPATPGLALSWGWVLSRINPPIVRQIISVASLAMVLGMIWSIGDWQHEHEDWRGGIARANELASGDEDVLFVYTSYVETASIEKLEDPRHSSYILSPVAAYPVRYRTVFALPFQANSAGREYWGRKFDQAAGSRPGYTVVLRRVLHFQSWLDEIMPFSESRGYRLTNREQIGQGGRIEVLRFKRREAEAGARAERGGRSVK